MPTDGVLEIATLAERHPGMSFVRRCAGQLIIRLSLDPTRLEAAHLSREVQVEHRSKGDPIAVREIVRTVGWTDLPDYTGAEGQRDLRTIGAETLTEWAAIGLMALLVHDLEGGRIIGLPRKGSGGDYEVFFKKGQPAARIEVSGIREDRTPSGSATTARVTEKRDQLLSYEKAGFVSVSTFAHGSDGHVRSILHYVRRTTARKPTGRGRRKP